MDSTTRPTPDTRLDALERTLFFVVEPLVDSIEKLNARLFALQALLEAKGIVVDAEVEAKMQAVREAGMLELEYGDDPAYEQFRKLRRYITEQGRGEPQGGGQ